tara:strand:+ start:344 stop:2161 length:1818 start_codon:yes stop_codon:yes gene_type:complete
MRYLLLVIVFLVQSCNPQKMEKLGDSLTTTANVLETLAPVFNKLDEMIYDFEYKGEMKNGKRHGYGTYIWKDKKFKGTKYVGYHKDNRMHGQGVITFPNGEKYVGRFIYDKYDGEGTYFYKNGTKQEGIWRGGIFVYPKKLTTKTEDNNSQSTLKTYDMGHGQTLTIDKSSNVKKEEQVKKKEDESFLSKADKLLGSVADGISKKDKITGLRTINAPFNSEANIKKRGEKSLNKVLNEAKAKGIRILDSSSSQYKRAERIIKRIVRASHYREFANIKFAVVDFKDFNALAFGGGYFVVFTGLMEQTNDDELAYVIAHELAHNSAGHVEETEAFLKTKQIFNKSGEGFVKSFINVQEQEADKIGILYTALGGFNPQGSVTIWAKRDRGLQELAFYRTHPANSQRSYQNQITANIVKKYYRQGMVNPKVAEILKCNELFCNKGKSNIADGKGGGLLKSLEVVADVLVKNKLAKREQKTQEQEINNARTSIYNQQLLTPPNVNWQGGWNLRYQGTINRHNQQSGLNFAFTQNLSQGQFYYKFNNVIEQGNIVFTGTNQAGYWFRWNDRYGQGNLQLREYTDGSLRGIIYLDDGTMLGRNLGKFEGMRR